MWQRHQEIDQQFAEYSDKYCFESNEGDSGFFSNNNICCSELSSNCSEEIQLIDCKSIESSEIMDIDVEFNDRFDQLSLENTSEDLVDFDKLETKDDFKKISQFHDTEAPWQLYFTQNNEGDTLLHTSIIQGDSFLDATLTLINIAPCPSLLDIMNDDHQTALHLAVMTNQPTIVRKLVVAGVDLSIRNYHGNTALHLACIHNNLDCAKALTEPVSNCEQNYSSSQRLTIVPQNLEQKNYHGETCLHIAAARNNVDLVKLLVQLNANIDSKESLSGRTALHLALEHRSLDVIYYIIHECQSQLDAVTYSGCTAYEIASYIDENLARELVKFGATSSYEENC